MWLGTYWYTLPACAGAVMNHFITPAIVLPQACVTMLCGRVNLISTSRHLVQSQSILRTQTGPLHSAARPEIIFEHAEVLAINKPPGVPFHSTDHVTGVIPILRCMETEGLLPNLGPLYPLHRSDAAITQPYDVIMHASGEAAGHQCQQALDS